MFYGKSYSHCFESRNSILQILKLNQLKKIFVMHIQFLTILPLHNYLTPLRVSSSLILLLHLFWFLIKLFIMFLTKYFFCITEQKLGQYIVGQKEIGLQQSPLSSCIENTKCYVAGILRIPALLTVVKNDLENFQFLDLMILLQT